MDNKGFTLFECLLSLFVLMSLMLFLQPFLVNIQQIQHHITKQDYNEVAIGKIQIEQNLHNETFHKIENNRLFLNREDGGYTIFEQYKQMIRKTSDRNGHQPIMMGVEKVLFSEDEQVITMEVWTTETEKYTYLFFFE